MKKGSSKKITFEISAPSAKDVRLAGDFNSWDSNKTLLKKTKSGIWKRDLALRPGRYEYKYLVDGQWVKDPLNKLFVVNSYGTENSVVEL